MKRTAALSLLLTACGAEELQPEGHVVLSITTDAPLPSAPGEVETTGQAPLFDRLRIEVIPLGQSEPCVGCTREVAADRESLDTASFSVVGGGAVDVRVRLFRSGGTASGQPRPRSSIDKTLRIDGIPQEGRRDGHAILRTDDIGMTAPPEPPRPGKAPRGLVGTWPSADRVLCLGEAAPGEACVPGGAQWLGDPRLDLSGNPDLDGSLERLVVVAPFYLDLHEVSVAEFRASGLAQSIVSGISDNPREKDTGIDGCTYTTTASETDLLPVNCLSWSKAKQYCESVGKRLPSEAEYERAASALGRSPYVWGKDVPRCEDAVFDRFTPGATCSGLGVGPTAPGVGKRDVLNLGGSGITDLAGNVSEWVADRWNRETEACWVPILSVDPTCDEVSPGDGAARVYRGGHFDSEPALLHSSVRGFIQNEDFAVDARIGFRCARD